MHPLAKLDQRHLWHPFTQMRDWLKREPIVIMEGKGAVLRDQKGREYLDANSSIWTNLHGHSHPKINQAITKQLKRISHSSALGLANEPAALLGAGLVKAAAQRQPAREIPGNPKLGKVFFSDDGSTAVEVALKLAYEFARRTGRSRKPKFLSIDGAYHGDTIGAVSAGHIDLFHKAYSGMLFKTDKVMAPYCYHCPFNKAHAERADARKYRKCNWECVGKVEQRFSAQRKRGEPYAAFVYEPLMQGAAGMIPQPSGWLRRVCELARQSGSLLIADEVMTGFGRTGVTCRITEGRGRKRPNDFKNTPLFASQRSGVQPDFLCLAKGLTGGYLPMAATLTTQAVFDAFLGKYEEFKTFFHGHSYTGNQLGASTGLASLELLQSEKSNRQRWEIQRVLEEELEILWKRPNVGDVRQVGLVVGVELVKDWKTKTPFQLREKVGIRVCEAMARRGVLTRPIGSVIVLMPPYCCTGDQVRKMVGILHDSIREVLG